MELIKKEIEFNSDKIFTVMKDDELYAGDYINKIAFII